MKYPLRLPDALVAAMYADYQLPMSLSAVGRKYADRTAEEVKEIFKRRGFAIRKYTGFVPPNDPVTGCFMAAKPFTKRQIDAFIAKATKVAIPAALAHEWRRWPMQRRASFIRRLRRRLKPAGPSALPYSSNVEPFDYASSRAQSICKALNEGLSSWYWKTKIDLCSQGVIWNGKLWFWTRKAGFISAESWTPERGRPLLSHAIWEQTHKRKVPPHHVVRFLDGNDNNLDPANLVLATKNDVCRENQAQSLARKSRELTRALLIRQQRKETGNGRNTNTLGQLQRAA